MCDALERAARRAARLAELNAAATLHGDEQHEAEHMRTHSIGVHVWGCNGFGGTGKCLLSQFQILNG